MTSGGRLMICLIWIKSKSPGSEPSCWTIGPRARPTENLPALNVLLGDLSGLLQGREVRGPFCDLLLDLSDRCRKPPARLGFGLCLLTLLVDPAFNTPRLRRLELPLLCWLRRAVGLLQFAPQRIDVPLRSLQTRPFERLFGLRHRPIKVLPDYYTRCCVLSARFHGLHQFLPFVDEFYFYLPGIPNCRVQKQLSLVSQIEKLGPG